MKKVLLVISMASLLAAGNINLGMAQDQPKPKKDTVNMDTEAKPTFYYAVEDEKAAAESSKGNTALIAIIAGVVVVGVAGFFLLKKKK
jgi:LPXTG-motif cell wall-anchored protein